MSYTTTHTQPKHWKKKYDPNKRWTDNPDEHKREMCFRHKKAEELFHKHYRSLLATQSYEKVIIPASEIPKLTQFAHDRWEDKKDRNDYGWTSDSHNAAKRGLYGNVGERALSISAEQHGIYMPMTFDIGPACKFSGPDFALINTGCKAARMGNIPVVLKRELFEHPQAICLVEELPDGSYAVYILGVAMPSVLADPKNRSDDGIIDPKMLYKKTAFIGTDALIPWQTYITSKKEELSKTEDMA